MSILLTHLVAVAHSRLWPIALQKSVASLWTACARFLKIAAALRLTARSEGAAAVTHPY